MKISIMYCLILLLIHQSQSYYLKCNQDLINAYSLDLLFLSDGNYQLALNLVRLIVVEVQKEDQQEGKDRKALLKQNRYFTLSPKMDQVQSSHLLTEQDLAGAISEIFTPSLKVVVCPQINQIWHCSQTREQQLKINQTYEQFEVFCSRRQLELGGREKSRVVAEQEKINLEGEGVAVKRNLLNTTNEDGRPDLQARQNIILTVTLSVGGLIAVGLGGWCCYCHCINQGANFSFGRSVKNTPIKPMEFSFENLEEVGRATFTLPRNMNSEDYPAMGNQPMIIENWPNTDGERIENQRGHKQRGNNEWSNEDDWELQPSADQVSGVQGAPYSFKPDDSSSFQVSKQGSKQGSRRQSRIESRISNNLVVSQFSPSQFSQSKLGQQDNQRQSPKLQNKKAQFEIRTLKNKGKTPMTDQDMLRMYHKQQIGFGEYASASVFNSNSIEEESHKTPTKTPTKKSRKKQIVVRKEEYTGEPSQMSVSNSLQSNAGGNSTSHNNNKNININRYVIEQSPQGNQAKLRIRSQFYVQQEPSITDLALDESQSA